MYLFGCAGSLLQHADALRCGVQALSSCSTEGLPVMEPQALGHMGSAVAAPGLSSAGSKVTVHRLWCPVACGI